MVRTERRNRSGRDGVAVSVAAVELAVGVAAVPPDGVAAGVRTGGAVTCGLADADVIAIRPMMNITLTYDHRLVDGAYAGRFLRDLSARLEAWEATAASGARAALA